LKPKWVPAWNWRSTTRADKIYLEIFAWPAGVFHLENVPRKVTKAYLLADSAHTPLTMTASGNALDIQLPAHAPDPIASVVVLETAK
jgi:alpha-L-fucosidase